MEGQILVLLFVVFKIVATIICASKAKKLNRSSFGWGLFGFFIPVVALIWVHCLKPVVKWESEEKDFN